MKINFITTVVNRPKFVEIQYLLFKKYCTIDFDFYVIDDSHNDSLSIEFYNICNKYNINYIKKESVNQKFTNPGMSNNPNDDCAHAVQWTYDNVIFKNMKDDYVLFLDSDMFLIDYFNPIEYMEDYVMCGLEQARKTENKTIDYIWNGIMFFNMKKMLEINDYPDFWCGTVYDIPVDVGGQLHFFIKNNNLNWKKTDVLYPEKIFNYDVKDIIAGFEFHCNKKILHFHAGTNWHLDWKNKKDLDFKKAEVFEKIINQYLGHNEN